MSNTMSERDENTALLKSSWVGIPGGCVKRERSKVRRWTHCTVYEREGASDQCQLELHIEPQHMRALGAGYGEMWILGMGLWRDDGGTQIQGPGDGGRFLVLRRNFSQCVSPQIRGISLSGSGVWKGVVKVKLLESFLFQGPVKRKMDPKVVVEIVEEGDTVLILMPQDWPLPAEETALQRKTRLGSQWKPRAECSPDEDSVREECDVPKCGGDGSSLLCPDHQSPKDVCSESPQDLEATSSADRTMTVL